MECATPRYIVLLAIEPHGLQQSGLVVRSKKTYTGRIVLAATPGTVVKVGLIWGSGANDRQVITIRPLSREYHTYPLRYTAAADSENATLEIAGTGTGEFKVGAVSLMPADNIDGFRPEVIATSLRRSALSWRQLCFVLRVALRSRRYRQAASHLRPRLARPAAQ